MYRLYFAPGAASMLVHWLLIELDLPYELQAVDLDAGEQKQPAYLEINPAGVVPTLVIDGQAHSQAAALALQLAETHPEAGLVPAFNSAARARYYEWFVYLANTLQPLFRQWWYPHEPAGADNADAVREHVQPRIEACWQRLDAHLVESGPYLLGEQLSAADFYLTMLMRWSRNMPKPASHWPGLAELAKRLKARPSFAVLCDREPLQEWT